jgi:hypothetical protein
MQFLGPNMIFTATAGNELANYSMISFQVMELRQIKIGAWSNLTKTSSQMTQTDL